MTKTFIIKKTYASVLKTKAQAESAEDLLETIATKSDHFFNWEKVEDYTKDIEVWEDNEDDS